MDAILLTFKEETELFKTLNANFFFRSINISPGNR